MEFASCAESPEKSGTYSGVRAQAINPIAVNSIARERTPIRIWLFLPSPSHQSRTRFITLDVPFLNPYVLACKRHSTDSAPRFGAAMAGRRRWADATR